ncbi:hypothetical protein A3J15_01020 [Candidatus Roizmanbacteria bacterium RIFCSPLOWO2_02_FULL_38_10]|uniref:Enolase n=1 Tax=Candidatus Roizmanbacteria bacterium RIFCSPLOWO2_02_FULL_38_10 TaxID=1802074 RepID=A0A1F7JJJ3_9BACT|nr:MAG: hypothetical protein A3J15_01020 [Candidatus Roizmanbacteria bacterium RIFCSPLOWO2_02_FULL_38_10]
MAKIKKINANEVLDSRGLPTIECSLILDNNLSVISQASSGESLGKYEGVELRDQDQTRYFGLGVVKAVSYINDLIAPKLIGVDPMRQGDIDHWLISADGTTNQEKLGVNTISIVSQIVLKAGYLASGLSLFAYINKLYCQMSATTMAIDKLPAIIVTLINGGKHGTRNLEFQEFQIIPATSMSFRQSLQFAVESYHALKQVLDYRNAGIAVSEEGGFAPSLLTNTDALEVVKESLMQRKIKLGVDVHLGLDLAASQYYINSRYSLKDKSQPLRADEYIEFIAQISKDYDLLILEDPLEQQDFNGWTNLNEKVGNNIFLAGDDFIAGKIDRLERAVKNKCCSAVVVKFNQSATVTQILEFILTAKKNNLKTIISHRLGEGYDTILADFAVGVQADFVKFGAPVRGERVAKYNRLLQIDTEIT